MALTEYERKRLENIKRNKEQLISLSVHSKLADLSALTKRNRPRTKAKSETPIANRKSLRTQGKMPDTPGLKYGLNVTHEKQTVPKPTIVPVKSAQEITPLSMRDVRVTSEPDEPLVQKILKSKDGKRIRASVDVKSMELLPQNIARVFPCRIQSVKFFPSVDLRMVVVGSTSGNLGFWNIDSEAEDGDGIHIYRPHPAPVSSICIHPFSMNKIVTGSHYGLVRTLDIENETFDLTYSTKETIECMSHRSDDINSLYIGEGSGFVRVLDERSNNSSMAWKLHSSMINTIDFNPENTNIMATSSLDTTACIWDLRKVGKESNSNPLNVIKRDGVVHSAYFSPSGNILATTSRDDKIGVVTGANFDDDVLLYCYNEPGIWHPSYKGVWGWDDSYFFVGNMERGVDVVSIEEKRVVTSFENVHKHGVLCRFDAHPFKAGMLAGATTIGHVYIWSL